MRYTYRLRLSVTAKCALLAEWDRCRWVWNQCTAESRRAWATGEDVSPAALNRKLTAWRREHEWLSAGASVPQQQIVRDFSRSRAKALKDIRNGVPQARRAGMPRFKKRRLADPTLNYTLCGFRLKNGRLHLARGIMVRVVWSRELPGAPSSVRIYRDSVGHWYASFVVSAVEQPLPLTGRAIGIDWGVREIATTTSDAYDLRHPGYGKTAATKLARYQRMMARRKPRRGQPPSNGYLAVKRQAAKLHKKVARQRRDTARKWAKAVVTAFDRVAVEDFKPRFLAKSTMSRKAHDAAKGATKTALLEMGRKHGRQVCLVHPAYSTMDCRRCGARAKHRLLPSERIYQCETCGNSSARDKNSAHVMLNRAGFTPDGVDCARPDRSPSGQAA
ncbi:transposase [Nocardia cyriacigeorgica]|uniref:RNA-guided endonuclease InsQ/TnpB family protein n=1 Tax=Nocardia cyriacigeorgica TaxID=135487 RepID=UPI0018938F26|nr:RNA-guided endonuclease TnpB family protein [Nocardia cyriacigeorgica]MBF6097259.1 transposase [Nocardia cyriacigeorgica]MBF6160837.1 transposase [Nocardia cyriacigeorgica]MBF6201579.1 transposase [Nocardia cyriacigeorgica]MBF6513417.1 transposase [Nocardia cyriacigeorgica]